MSNDFSLESYDYHLPPENIAQQPAASRDGSRLLVLDRQDNSISHKTFADIGEYMTEGDLVVVNNTRVFPARLYGRKKSGGRVEVFLLNFPELEPGLPGKAETTALLRSSKRPTQGSTIIISSELSVTVKELLADGKARLQLHYTESEELTEILAQCGQVPLPPYILRKQGSTSEDISRYQTVYAEHAGAVAAPTAGLHFTPELMAQLENRNIRFASLTLHVGYGTFAPVRTENILEHNIHSEYVSISKQTVGAIKETKQRGGRVWAVGTTTVRALEFAAKNGTLQAIDDWCDLYIYPGYSFQVIDRLITNFHLPQSSLMFLVAALCGREHLLASYKEAIRQGYRFYSYGDAMAIL